MYGNVSSNFRKGTSINHVKSRGGGELAEIIFLNKPYLVNVTTKGEGIKILKNLTIWFMDDPKTNL